MPSKSADRARDRRHQPQVALTRRGLCWALTVRGELDLASAGLLERLLEQTPSRRGAVVLVDFTACTFIDSAVVALLVRWDRRARATGGELVSLVAPGPVCMTLGLTGVLEQLNVVQEPVREPTGRPRRARARCGRAGAADPAAASGRLHANDHEGPTAGKDRRGPCR